MAAMSAEVTSQPLKYQTWFLKVSIHCEGCRRKVKKVLHSIDGVFTTTIDPQQQKVTVTGSVGVETLIRKLVKAGKPAEVWPENVAVTGKGKDSNKAKKKKSKQGDPDSVENHHASANTESNLSSGKDRGIENAEKCKGESKSSNSKTGAGSSDKSPAGGQAPERDQKGGQNEGGTGKGGGGDSGKKKIKKAQSGGGGTGSNGLSSASTGAPAHTGSQFHCPGQMNLSPTRQQSYPYPEAWYPPMVHLATYNRLCPMGTMGGPSYYVPPLPYMCAGLDHYPYHFQSTPSISFEIFSDENANGCSVM